MAINLNNIYNQTPKTRGNQRQSGTFTPDTGRVVNNPNQPMLPENASMGEATRFLYDTRLQNVFNDYQQSVASLQQSEQNQLQDAYYIRELSKKYLGEYASNVGIGDVSGNLLDIYGSYQKNVMSIQQQSEQMKLGLQQTFDEKSRAAFEGAIAAQLQAEQIQLDENATTALFNITQGNMGGQEWNVYLQSQLDSGAITQQMYQQLFSRVYQAKINEMEENFDRNFFGFKTDAEGNRVMMTKEEYIDANKSWLNSTDLQRLKDYALIQTTGRLTIKSVDKFEWFDLMGLGGSGQSFEITDEDGNVISYATAPNPVDSDATATIQVTSEELTEAFENQEGAGLLISGQTTFQYKGNYYYYTETALEGGTWYRAINYTATAELYKDLKDPNTKQSEWNFKQGGNILVTKYFSYDKKADTLTLTNDAKTVLVYDTKFSSNDVNLYRIPQNNKYLTQEQQSILKEFVRQHGGGAKDGDDMVAKNGWDSLKDTVIFYNGYFYTLDHRGHLRRFTKKQ
jgi:hypothetical protein